MDVRCSRCATEYEFDDALISERGTDGPVHELRIPVQDFSSQGVAGRAGALGGEDGQRARARLHVSTGAAARISERQVGPEDLLARDCGRSTARFHSGARALLLRHHRARDRQVAAHAGRGRAPARCARSHRRSSGARTAALGDSRARHGTRDRTGDQQGPCPFVHASWAAADGARESRSQGARRRGPALRHAARWRRAESRHPGSSDRAPLAAPPTVVETRRSDAVSSVESAPRSSGFERAIANAQDHTVAAAGDGAPLRAGLEPAHPGVLSAAV